jgi:acetyltransferase-like isoleucine patch superfamily enzyme
MDYLVVVCEQFNVNDNEYKLVDVYVENGKQVKRNELLLSLDSSKAVLDVESQMDGHFFTKLNNGEYVKVGDPLYIIVSEKTVGTVDIDSLLMPQKTQPHSVEEHSSNKVITKKARQLMMENGLTEELFKEDVITEDVVQQMLNATKKKTSLVLQDANFHVVKRLAFIGAGQGLIQALDIVFQGRDFIPCVIYDDTPEKQGTMIFNIPVKGGVDFEAIANDFANGVFDVIINVVSVSIPFRKKVFDALHALSIPFANLIHSTASVGFNTRMGTGNVIFAQASVGACSEIGDDNFISAHCNIEHHNSLGSHCTFGPGVMTSGNVRIGNENKFGTGIFVEPGLTIKNNCTIASGVIIGRNIEDNILAYTHGAKLSFKHLNES